MKPFQTLLVVFFSALLVYTIFAIINEGTNFFPGYFGGLSTLKWEGQIYLDFSMYLALSWLWVAWRGGFTASSIALGGVLAVVAMLGFALYLLYLVRQTKGDMRTLLLGVHAKSS